MKKKSVTEARVDPSKEASLQVHMPISLLKQLKLVAIERDTSVRAVVLKSLSDSGFDVGEISDRRRTTKK